MKKRIMAIILCFTMVFTMTGYVGLGDYTFAYAEESLADETTIEMSTYEKIYSAESVEEMYTITLQIMNDEPDSLKALTADEIAALRTRVTILDPENDDIDTQDMLDTLSILPNGGAESEVVTLGTGQIGEQSCTGDTFLANADSNGNIQLLGNVTVTTPIKINRGKKYTIDLNGYVLRSDAVEKLMLDETKQPYQTGKNVTFDPDTEFKRVIILYGELEIKDSRPNTVNSGTMIPVARWIDKRLDGSKTVNNDGKTIYQALDTYTDRYYWATTTSKEFWYYDGKGATDILGGVITGGMSTSGGGIYVGGGKLTINGGTIAGNRSTRYIAVNDADQQKETAGNGGGIYAARYASGTTISDAKIIMNKGSIKYNWTDYLGGGVATTSVSTEFWMNSGDITENCAQGSGGGLTVRGGSKFYLGEDENNQYTKASAPTIEANRTFSTRYHGGGGGIEVDGGSLVYVVGKVINNYASGSGGGIYCYRGGSVNAKTDQSVISGNEAGGGGGIYLQYGDVILEDVILSNNTARSTGGAVGIRVGNFVMTGGKIINNTSKSHGGAAYIHSQNNYTPHGDIGSLGCSASIDGTLVEGNEAYGNGGAFYVSVANSSENVNVDINNSTIIRNKAGTKTSDGRGGAVYLSGGTLTVSGNNTVVSNNTADAGGAFYVEDRNRTISASTSSPYTMNLSEIERYNLTHTEKPIELDESGEYYNVDFSNSFLTNNSGYNFINYTGEQVKPGKVVINAGTISYNEATQTVGGAMYVKGSQSLVEINGGNLQHNTAKTTGGAAFVDGGNVLMNDGTFANNTAVNGGAVYIKGGDFTMTSGSIINNKAEGALSSTGGGVYADGGNIVIGIKDCNGGAVNTNHTKAPTNKTHPIIQGNTANDSGGGIALIGNGDITMYCGTATENDATNRGRGLNIYMEKGTFNLYKGNVGSPTNPELVIVGGKLVYRSNDLNDDDSKKVYLNYHHCNDADCDSPIMVAAATKDSYFNLPDGLKYWNAANGFSFSGWTFNGPADQQLVVRKMSDYSPLGTEIKVEDKYDSTQDQNMHLYALWVPSTNDITYKGVTLVDGKYTSVDINVPKNPTEYEFAVGENFVSLASPTKDRYEVTGWYIYQDEGQNANWGVEGDASAYEPSYLPGTADANKNYDTLDYSKLTFIEVGEKIDFGSTHFGDVTLIAKFVPTHADLKVTKTGWNETKDPNQTFIFEVKGNDENTKNIDMTVTIQGNGSVIIKDLPVGKYLVEEKTEWSWRYLLDKILGGSNPKVVTITNPEKTGNETVGVEFINARQYSFWLSGDSYCENIWKNGAIDNSRKSTKLA